MTKLLHVHHELRYTQVFNTMKTERPQKEAGMVDKGRREACVGNLAYSVSKDILQVCSTHCKDTTYLGLKQHVQAFILPHL